MMRSLTVGNPLTLIAGEVYALPGRKVFMRVQQTGGTIEVSNDNTTFAAATLSANGDFETAAAFIRAVTADAIVLLKV